MKTHYVLIDCEKVQVKSLARLSGISSRIGRARCTVYAEG
jgi:uncharacterized lipoprotein YehR (DUF1307 family)